MPGESEAEATPPADRIEAEIDFLLSGFGKTRKGMDIGSVFLGASGIVTASRGLVYLTSSAPSAAAFDYLGPVFVTTWSWAWLLVGLGVTIVAITGYRWPRADRAAAFALLTLWWTWALLYFASALSGDSGRALADLLSGVILSVTGVALTAGVILGLRQAQEKRLREVASRKIAELDEDVDKLIALNAELSSRNDDLAARLDQAGGDVEV